MRSRWALVEKECVRSEATIGGKNEAAKQAGETPSEREADRAG